MCTLALYFRVFHDRPIVVAANRDEHYDRPSVVPGLLNTTPAMIAGRDLRAGGTWLGVNDHGLWAGILNRRSNGEQSPRPAARSRGLLCLDLLRVNSAAAACALLRDHEQNYQPFTVVFADANEAWAAYNNDQEIKLHPVDGGLHVFSSAAEFDAHSEKADRAYDQFARLVNGIKAAFDQPSAWLGQIQTVLGDHSLGDETRDPRDAICVHGEVSGTVCSSIILYSRAGRRFTTYYCDGAPCQNSFGPPLTLNLR